MWFITIILTTDDFEKLAIHQHKHSLVDLIKDKIKAHQYEPETVRKMFSLDPMSLSQLLEDSLEHFSTDKLISYLALMGTRIELTVHDSVALTYNPRWPLRFSMLTTTT